MAVLSYFYSNYVLHKPAQLCQCWQSARCQPASDIDCIVCQAVLVSLYCPAVAFHCLAHGDFQINNQVQSGSNCAAALALQLPIWVLVWGIEYQRPMMQAVGGHKQPTAPLFGSFSVDNV